MAKALEVEPMLVLSTEHWEYWVLLLARFWVLRLWVLGFWVLGFWVLTLGCWCLSSGGCV